MIKNIILILTIFIISINAVQATQATKIELSASQDTVELGGSFTLSVTLKNASTGSINIKNIEIPGVENFRQIGSSESTQVQMLNGATTIVKEVLLTLTASREGDYKLGPARIVENSKLIAESRTISVKVVKKQKKSIFSKSNEEERALVGEGKTGGAVKDFISGKIFINLAFFIALIWMGYYLYKKREKNRVQGQEADNGENPDKKYKIILPDIQDKYFFEKAKEALLEYLRKKYSVDGEALTSREILASLKNKNISGFNNIEKAIELCDNGKFAVRNSGKTKLLEIIKKLSN